VVDLVDHEWDQFRVHPRDLPALGVARDKAAEGVATGDFGEPAPLHGVDAPERWLDDDGEAAIALGAGGLGAWSWCEGSDR
jgi:hypothetical protein